MDIFDKEFEDLLAGRTNVISCIKDILSLNETDKFCFEVVEFTNYDDTEIEFPGYQIYLKGKNTNVNYSYLLMDISLPTDINKELPVLFEHHNLNKQAEYYIDTIDGLANAINSLFNSKEYKNIINRLLETLWV